MTNKKTQTYTVTSKGSTKSVTSHYPELELRYVTKLGNNSYKVKPKSIPHSKLTTDILASKLKTLVKARQPLTNTFIVAVAILEQGSKTRFRGKRIISFLGGNLWGIQTDNSRWGGTGGVSPDYRWALKDNVTTVNGVSYGGYVREFAGFDSLKTALQFMVNVWDIRGKHVTDATSFATTYIRRWWAPRFAKDEKNPRIIAKRKQINKVFPEAVAAIKGTNGFSSGGKPTAIVVHPIPKKSRHITSKFGPRTLKQNGKKVPGFHTGVDFGGTLKVMAPEEMKVERFKQPDDEYPTIFGKSKEKGYYTLTNIPKGRAWTPYLMAIGTTTKTRYIFKHIRTASFVKPNMTIPLGTIFCGTGNWGYSQGAHLHLEIWLYVKDKVKKRGRLTHYPKPSDATEYFKTVGVKFNLPPNGTDPNFPYPGVNPEYSDVAFGLTSGRTSDFMSAPSYTVPTTKKSVVSGIAIDSSSYDDINDSLDTV